ncbi:MAG: hypothetical protein JWO69_1698 [Thermoleophilia bacterium]|nr:hypothetical protein [Thermoleophilia bacterium]
MRLRATVDGRTTTVHVARYVRADTRLRIERLEPAMALPAWVAQSGEREALNGGFFTKPDWVPLGRVQVDGTPTEYVSFRGEWAQRRGGIWIDGDEVRIAAVGDLPEEAFDRGHMLQASPVLVQEGRVVVADSDPEGLSTTQDEFDSDITADPLPRVAIAVNDDELLAVAADGRSDDDAGFLLPEFAAVLVELGASAALNIDGGTSSALITAGELRNNPRNDDGIEFPDGYPTPSVFVFEAR